MDVTFLDSCQNSVNSHPVLKYNNVKNVPLIFMRAYDLFTRKATNPALSSYIPVGINVLFPNFKSKLQKSYSAIR